MNIAPKFKVGDYIKRKRWDKGDKEWIIIVGQVTKVTAYYYTIKIIYTTDIFYERMGISVFQKNRVELEFEKISQSEARLYSL